MNRRDAVAQSMAALSAILIGAPLSARAAVGDYPEGPLRMIIPFPPGGQTDSVGRALANRLSEGLGRVIVVDNKPGGNTVVGTEIVARQPGDGTTMSIVAGSTMVLNPLLLKKLSYDTERDLKLLTIVTEVPMLLVVPADRPYKDLAQLVTYAKANPGKLNFASVGIGSSLHLTGELFAARSGIDIVHIPYKGSSPAMIELISGGVDMMFDAPSTALPQVKAGKLRALAVTTASRVSFLPDVPTVAETLPGFATGIWYGVAIRRDTPVAIAQKLKSAIDAALLDPALRSVFEGMGAVPLKPASVADNEAFMAKEKAGWKKLIGDRKISMD